MQKNTFIVVLITGLVGFIFGLYASTQSKGSTTEMDVVSEVEVPLNPETETNTTERYSARVDRVDVVFEHTDFTRYKLQTNELVREGELNTERGFEDDTDATVYVLNWQKPEGEQMRYVRLTNEPGRLYLLDSESKIIRGSVLVLE